jgi:tetratricopeptide (TPR) repeat protein
MLAVFSLPTATSVLALRRERYELTRLIRRIGARQRRRVELAVVQYGVTRERLARIAEVGDGWDVLHLSGHGGRGAFLLERPDGSPDPVDANELVAMLAPLRRRLRLAVVSACESAAATMAETLRLVGLAGPAEQLEQAAADQVAEPALQGGAEQVMTGVARALAAQLGGAVVAMRYPVVDDFAIAFTEELYQRLLGSYGRGSQGQPLGTALARAATQAAGPAPSPSRPALSLATPILLGADAADLILEAPQEQPALDLELVRMERFPPEPERFVGRAQAMALASAALAPGSDFTGVLLYGMAGSGKTACALELAYRHQDSFAMAAFWQAPMTDDEFGGALASLAAALEIQLGAYGFTMSDKITTVESLAAFAPRLSHLLQDAGVLLVLDNLETLLTPSGHWRDPRWQPLIDALTGHRGESRVIFTTRVPPNTLGRNLLALTVHALDLSESVALARELPNLRGLLHADASPVRDAARAEVVADRDLVRRVLYVVQGHPKLMELADAAAADPARLAAQLDAAAHAARGQVLDEFFRDSSTALNASDFLATLTVWTNTAMEGLPEPARLMVQFLSCLEDSDRDSVIVAATWESLWKRLGRPSDPPTLGPILAALGAAALIQADSPAHGNGVGDASVSYRIHPGVAETVRASASTEVQAASENTLAEFWQEVATQAVPREGDGAGQVIVRAGLAAAPYLLRLRDWDIASAMLEMAILRDSSPSTVQAALPSLRVIVDATQAPAHLGMLARVVRLVDPAQAELMLRSTLAEASAAEDFRLASSAAGDLVNLLLEAGRLAEALSLADDKVEYGRRAGEGPWTRLADHAMRLQILGFMGDQRQVLDEVSAAMAQMDRLSNEAGASEAVVPWNVRETMLDIGRASAVALGMWQQCLDFNRAILDSKQARGAGSHEIARTSFNNAGPLVRLGRFAEAQRLLLECQQEFEDHNDLSMLARTLSARADLEAEHSRYRAATELEQTALRFKYSRPDPSTIAVSHSNLASYLFASGSTDTEVISHQLVAALIFHFTNMNFDLARTLREIARTLQAEPSVQLPVTINDLVRIVELTEGVHFGQMIARIAPDPKLVTAAIAQLLEMAQDPAVVEELDDEPTAANSTPLLFADLVIAAVRGEALAQRYLDQALTELATVPATAGIASWIRLLQTNVQGTVQTLQDANTESHAELIDYIVRRVSDPSKNRMAEGQ